jgi:hypothetical protein
MLASRWTTSFAISLFFLSPAMALEWCPPPCSSVANPWNRTDCVCASRLAPNFSLVLLCGGSSIHAESCGIKCPDGVAFRLEDLRSIGLNLSKTSSLTLSCSYDGSYVDVLEAVGATNVKSLTFDVSHNSLVLSDEAFANIHKSQLEKSLISLTLKGEGIAEVASEQVFAPLTSVQNLAIKGTGLISLPNNSFSAMRSLVSLEISENNELKVLPSDVFANLSQLVKLDLSDNGDLERLPRNILFPLESLRDVRLSHGQFLYFPRTLFALNPNLHSVSIVGDNCPDSCIRNFSSEFLRNVTALREFRYGALYNENVLSTTFPLDFFEANRDLHVVEFWNAVLPNGDLSLFKPLGKLKRLRLVKTNVAELDCGLLPASLTEVFFFQNEFNCSCKTIACLLALGVQSHAIKDMFKISLDCNGTAYNVTEAHSQFCEAEQTSAARHEAVAIAVPILVVVAVSVVAVALVRRHRQQMAAGAATKGDFAYDTFISYDDSDRQFAEALIVQLEEEKNLKCCSHKRDFRVGAPIEDNIVAAVETSRSVVIVVSRHFLRSSWCQQELQAATRRHKAILLIMRSRPDCAVTRRELEAAPHVYDHIKAVTYLTEDDATFIPKLTAFLAPAENGTSEETWGLCNNCTQKRQSADSRSIKMAAMS